MFTRTSGDDSRGTRSGALPVARGGEQAAQRLPGRPGSSGPPRARAIVFTACRPVWARARKTVFFWLSPIQRLAQDRVLQGLFAEQPLQLTHLALRGAVLGGRNHLFAGAHCRQRAFGVLWGRFTTTHQQHVKSGGNATAVRVASSCSPVVA